MIDIILKSIKDLFDKKIFVYILQLLMFTHFNLKRLQSLR